MTLPKLLRLSMSSTILLSAILLLIVSHFGTLVAKVPFVQLSSEAPVRSFRLENGQTLAELRDEIRAWRAGSAENATAPAEAIIPPGELFLSEPLEFSAEDSFTTWKAEQNDSGAPAVVTRLKRIDGWKLENGRLKTHISAVADGTWWFESLYVNDRRAVVARTPNANVPDGRRYFYIHEAGEMAASSSFVPRNEQTALFEEIRQLDPAKIRPTDVQIQFYHSWETSRHRIASVDAQSKLVTLTGGARWSLMYWGPNLRYHVEGVPSALDQPGEFLLERDGTLTYIPLPGQTAENTVFAAPNDPKSAKQTGFKQTGFDQTGFVRITGTEQKPVRNLVFEGIDFNGDVYNLPEAGLSDGQAAVSSPASITANYAQNIHFNKCSVRHVGGYGFWFHMGCTGCKVTGTLIEDLGAGGVRIGAGHGPNITDSNLTRGNTVENCIIRGYGRLDGGAIGVWIGHSPDNIIVHNDISDGFYTGVSVGWVWGYRPSRAVNNKIEFNHIHHIGQGVLSDMGGVYSLGISPGTTVSNNVIHDVNSYNRYGRGGWGLYTDEGSSEITMENNLVYRVHTGTFHQHYGKDNIVRNNILAFSRENQLQRSRPEEHRSFTFERNIVLWEDGPKTVLLQGSWKNQYSDVNKNIYWCLDGADKVRFDDLTLVQWQQLGKDTDSVIADPMFVNASGNDFRFTDASKPVLAKIGFQPFDFTQAGVYKTDPKWLRTAEDYTYPTVILAPDAPPLQPMVFLDSFDPPRAQTIKKVANPSGLPGSYTIIEENGNRFLRISDTPDQLYTFNPHFTYQTHHPAGTSVVSFDTRLADGAVLMIEWRDVNSPYRVGPSVHIRDQKVFANGQLIGDLPYNQWSKVQISCPTGENRGQEYRIAVTTGDKTVEKAVRIGNGSWHNFDNLVFAALASLKTTIDLDNVEIRF